MKRSFCDICKKEMIESRKHYEIELKERTKAQFIDIPELHLLLEDVCHDCYTDILEHIKKRGYYNDRSKTD